MNLMLKKLTILAVSAIGIFAASQSYGQLTYATPNGSTDSGGNVDAQAVFSLTGDVLTIQLSSLEENPSDVYQLVSGLEFDVTGGTKATLGSAMGVTTTIGSTGSYSPSNGKQNLPNWSLASSSGSSIDLSTFGNNSPYDMIIGPDNKGGFSGSGKYSNGGSSIHNEPVVLGTATFTITVNGLNSLSQLSDVQFDFGSMPSCDTVCGVKVNTPTPVPEPATIISGLLLLVPLSIQVVRQMRNQKKLARVEIRNQK
jgi:hypothetical protein